MERVEGIEPSHQPWQGRRLPLHHTRFKMVDRKRIELFPKACKAPVLPLSPTAHLKSTLSYLDQIRPGQTYRGVSCPSRCWSQPQHAHCFKMVGMIGLAPTTS